MSFTDHETPHKHLDPMPCDIVSSTLYVVSAAVNHDVYSLRRAAAKYIRTISAFGTAKHPAPGTSMCVQAPKQALVPALQCSTALPMHLCHARVSTRVSNNRPTFTALGLSESGKFVQVPHHTACAQLKTKSLPENAQLRNCTLLWQLCSKRQALQQAASMLQSKSVCMLHASVNKKDSS